MSTAVRRLLLSLLAGTAWAAQAAQPAQNYRNFEVAVYARAQEVARMGELDWLRPRFETIAAHVRLDKIYLETHRDRNLVDSPTLQRAIGFFRERGIEVAGGITLTISEPNRFETFCYSNPEHRAWVRQVVEHTARHFDELILDDFFFTSCKSEIEIAARGERSWTEYRLELMREAAQSLVIGPARAVNPRVKVVIKYPNWYEHFQGLGFNLEAQPAMFDGIYTGTETRDAVRSAQHLQPYLGYLIFRYFESLAPGRNGGGWVDTAGVQSIDRYAEQLWLTAFAKAPEITLFDFNQLQNPVAPRLRGAWQDLPASFDFDAMMETHRRQAGDAGAPPFAMAAGIALAQVDAIAHELGTPLGVKSYRPHHATGEDFLHNYLGMIGIPVDLRAEYPEDAGLVLLTQSAAHDPDIVGRIERHVRGGGNVVITSGLLQQLQERGLDRIAEIRHSGRSALVRDFQPGSFGPLVAIDEPMLIPQITYLTNDSWELVSAIAGPNGWPLLHDADYGRGHLFVLAIPDNFADLYRLPAAVLNPVRRTITQHLPVRLEGPSQVSLFAYDNDTFIVQSFRDEPVELQLVVGPRGALLRDLQSGARLEGQAIAQRGPRPDPDAGRHRHTLRLEPHSFRVLRATPQ